MGERTDRPRPNSKTGPETIDTTFSGTHPRESYMGPAPDTKDIPTEGHIWIEQPHQRKQAMARKTDHRQAVAADNRIRIDDPSGRVPNP